MKDPFWLSSLWPPLIIGRMNSLNGRQPFKWSLTKDRRKTVLFLPEFLSPTSITWCLQPMNTFWTTKVLCAKYNGSTSWWMKVTEWKILKVNLQWLWGKPTHLHTEFYSLVLLFKTILLSYGRCLTFYCLKFSAPAKSSKSGSINLCQKFTQWLLKPQSNKEIKKFLNLLKKSSYSSSTAYIRSLDHSSCAESSLRWKKSCLPSLSSLSKWNSLGGRR